MRVFFISIILFILSGCVSTHENSNDLSQAVDEYFRVYSERNNFESLMSFYSNEAHFEDIIYGNHLKNKAEIRNFLAWDKGEFKVLEGQKILTITSQVVGVTTAVTEGFFHEFSYDGQKLGPWLFVIVHEFNTHNKIIKQTDWINYTPRTNFLGGKNMNNELIHK